MPTLVEQLRALAGAAPDARDFSIARSTRIVAISYSPGSTETIELSTPFPSEPTSVPVKEGPYRRPVRSETLSAPRPLHIRLRLETQIDRDAKQSGRNREIQTGDPPFDDAVYIDARSEDSIVLAVLHAPEARSAILELLRSGARSVTLDDLTRKIRVLYVDFLERSPDRERAAQAVEALDRLASAVPGVVAEGVHPPDRLLGLLVVGGAFAALGVVAAPMAYIIYSPARCLVTATDEDGTSTTLKCTAGPECCQPAGAALAAALLLAVPILAFASSKIRGRSNSRQNFKAAVVITLAVLIELCVLIARFTWR